MNKTLIKLILLTVGGWQSQVALGKVADLNVHGFIAQGIIQASDSNFVNNDGDVSLELTEVGVNASYRLTPQLRVSGQAVYLNGGNRFANGPRIDHLFVDWQFYNSLDTQLNLYVGRLKSYHRLHSATRDVPHTRPSIILPQSLYIDVFRDISIGPDGALLRGNFVTSLGEWSVNWNYGHASISDDQRALFIAEPATGDLELTRERQGSVYWRPLGTNIQLGASYVNALFTYDQGSADFFTSGSVQTKGHTFNVRYNTEHYTLTSEYSRLRTLATDLLFDGARGDSASEGMYVEGQYYFSPTVAGLLRIDLFDRNRKDRDGSLLPTNFGIPDYFGYMDQVTVGVSWDFKPNWRLQAEVHRVKGTGRLAPILIPDVVTNNQKYWDIWAVQLMYWF